jgi:MYXO-CTERM domain-containing protein
MRLARGLLLLLSGLFPALAPAAQTYVVSSAQAPFAPLTNPIVPALSGNLDAGYAVVPIGFDFPFYGRTYSQLTVTTDGAAYLEPSPGAASYPANMVFPSGAVPNGVLAPFWDNLKAQNAFSRLSHQLIPGPSGQVLVVEWRDFNHWSSSATYSLTFQLRLHENGLVQFHYGVFTGAGAGLTASVGIENHTGSVGVTGKACTPGCTPQHIVQDEVLTFGPAPGTVDLVAGALVVEQVTDNGGVLTLDTRFVLRNFGTDPVAAVQYALFLSTDTVLDPGDIPLSPAEQGPLALGPMDKISHLATSTVARPSTGAWYVLAQVDPQGQVPEVSLANNLSASASPLVSGVDLVALGISASVASAGPGEQITNTLQFTNAGIDAAGPVQWRILLSKDTVLDASDLVMHSGTTSLSGGQTVSEQVSYALPSNVPLGSYWFVLQLDPQGQLPELYENNNVAFSQTQFQARQADLVVGVPTLHDPVPPHGLAPQLYFGEPFRMEIPVSNAGGALAKDFTLVAYLSENDILNAVNDPEAGESLPQTLPAHGAGTVVLEGVVPSHAPGGAAYAQGDYFFFAYAFSNGNFVEVTQSNNVNRALPIRLRAPGPDLTPTLLSTPAALAPGEPAQVKRVIRNLGNRASDTVPYRYVLTRNTLVTEQDVPVQVVLPDGALVDGGTVNLAVGALDSKTETVLVPHGLPAGSWHLGVLVDPAGAHDDIQPSNNGLASAPLDLLPPAVTVHSLHLPAALVGVPYQFQLSVSGGLPPWTFSVVEGALPAGIALDGQGSLTGTATQQGLFPFTLEVKDAAGRPAQVRLVLQAVAQTLALSILTERLPAAVKGEPYELQLGVQGGQAPWSWALAEGSLPEGLVLEASGRLHGTGEGEVGAQSAFELRVFDSAGQAASRAFTLHTVAEGSLSIDKQPLPPGVVGQAYLTDVVARAPGSLVLPPPVSWQVLSGTLPPGLALSPQAAGALLVEGLPTAPGAFAFALGVTDGAGRSDVRDHVLLVHPNVQRLVGRYPRAALPGTQVEGSIRFEGEPEASYRLHSGGLPPGLGLSSEGTLSGALPADTPLQIHSFVVVGRRQDGAEGTAAFYLEVTDTLPGTAGCGCVGALGPGAGWLALLGLATLARRRRRR